MPGETAALQTVDEEVREEDENKERALNSNGLFPPARALGRHEGISGVNVTPRRSMSSESGSKRELELENQWISQGSYK